MFFIHSSIFRLLCVNIFPVMIKSIGHVVVLNNIPFKIEEKKVLRELRIPRSIETLKDINEEHIARDIKNAIDLAYSLIKGAACYCTFKVEVFRDENPHPHSFASAQDRPALREVEGVGMGLADERVTIPESDTLFRGENMLRLLKKCDYATLLVCTIGDTIVKKIEVLTKSSLTEAYYLERVAAWMADYMAEYIGTIIETEIRKNGFEPTFRYAAGYGDWGLEAQSEIMRLTEAEKIGVSITEYFIMEPRFSVSAVIGWQRRG